MEPLSQVVQSLAGDRRGSTRIRRRRSEFGFTILEVMITLTILLVATTSVYLTLLPGQILSNDNKQRHRALQDVASLTEQMAIIPLANLATTFEHDSPIPAFANLHVPNQEVRVLYENPATATVPPVNFRVVTTWTSTLGRQETLVIRGVRAR